VDLEQAVSRGHFRRDLYFRLDVLHLDMPPLRTRGADVELLARRFLEEFRKQHTVTARGFDSGARRALGDYHWPGNVRELLNRVRRAAVIARQPLISADDLQLSAAEAPTDACLDSARTSAERETVLATLRETGFNVSACARRLQVSRVTVYRLCKKHRLSLADLR
jgi:DNA-binding NtrC family response regulator